VKPSNSSAHQDKPLKEESQNNQLPNNKLPKELSKYLKLQF